MVKEVILVFRKLTQRTKNLLRPKDIVAMKKLLTLKEQVKLLEENLRSRIQATFEEHGKCNVQIGKEVVKLSRSYRNSTSWKGLIYHLLKSRVIDENKEDFTNEFTYYYAKPLGLASQFKDKRLAGGITRI